LIPISEQKHNDLVDLIIEAAQTVQNVTLDDGTQQKQLILDPETIYWKTHIVNSPTFGRLVYELKEWENLASACDNNMSPERAVIISKGIIDIARSWRYSIDAKSSESIRDRHNTQSTFIDKVNRNKVEKAYTVKGDAKKSFMDGLMGREAEQERNED
jgi:hypothetical protein